MIHHVGIEVAPGDIARAVELFELLGFARVELPAGLADDYTWLERGGGQIHLMHAERPVVPPRGHLALVAPGFAATLARLREAGFEVKPSEPYWGSPRALVAAPGGHRVELMEFPPAA